MNCPHAGASRKAAYKCADDQGFGWRAGPAWVPPHELRPAARRAALAPPDAWERLDYAIEALSRARTGVSVTAIARAFGDLSDAAWALAETIEQARPSTVRVRDVLQTRGSFALDRNRSAVAGGHGHGDHGPADGCRRPLLGACRRPLSRAAVRGNIGGPSVSGHKCSALTLGHGADVIRISNGCAAETVPPDCHDSGLVAAPPRNHVPMAIDAVIFDIGGVLEITPATSWDDRWAARLGLDRSDMISRLEPIWNAGEIGAISLDDIEQWATEALGLREAEVPAFMDDQWSEYLGTLNEDLARYFAELRPRFRTGILSNSFVGAREREQDAYGFEEMCDVVVYSHEEGIRKPDARFYGIVCDRLGVQPQTVLFLDDVQACVEGARRVGMTPIRFVNNEQAIAELDHHLGQAPSR